MAEGATKTALAIGSKWQEQAFGTGDHKPWLVPGQAQTTTRLGRQGKHKIENKPFKFQFVTKRLSWFLGKHNHHQPGPGMVILNKICRGAKISSVPDTSAPHIGQHSPNL